MIGAFYQPQVVLADIDTLKTLPARGVFCRDGRSHQIRFDS